MSMGGGGKGGGGVDLDSGTQRRTEQAWDMTQQRNDLQNQVIQQFLDPWQGEGPPQDMKYSNPFWWDQ